jgi:hypothetical protein
LIIFDALLRSSVCDGTLPGPRGAPVGVRNGTLPDALSAPVPAPDGTLPDAREKPANRSTIDPLALTTLILSVNKENNVIENA